MTVRFTYVTVWSSMYQPAFLASCTCQSIFTEQQDKKFNLGDPAETVPQRP
jgi:hypothetical protein